MAERDRIARYFAPLAADAPGSFHLSDDAAVVTAPPGQQLVVTTDSVIQSIHVLTDATAAQYAQKLMRRNLSDLAAMGATPWHYTLNLHTPKGLKDAWFEEFAQTLAAEQHHFAITLIGGDSTSGGTSIHTSMTCFGLLSLPPLRRHGAHIGDDLYVSGTIGDAALALKLLQQKHAIPAEFAARYHAPEPRLMLGQALQGLATAVIDISDGLIADAIQLCRTSGVGAHVWRDAIPLSPTTRQWLQQEASLWELFPNGGDDYELCFTASPEHRDTIAQLGTRLGLPLTCIGTITPGHALVMTRADGSPLPLDQPGWEYH